MTVFNTPKIHVRSSEEGDWSAVYLDGKLATQGHVVEWWSVLHCLGIKFTTEEVEVDDDDPEAMFPDTL